MLQVEKSRLLNVVYVNVGERGPTDELSKRAPFFMPSLQMKERFVDVGAATNPITTMNTELVLRYS